MPARETTIAVNAVTVTALSDGAVANARLQVGSVSDAGARVLVRATLVNTPPSAATFAAGAFMMRFSSDPWRKDLPLTGLFNAVGPFYLWGMVSSGAGEVSISHD